MSLIQVSRPSPPRGPATSPQGGELFRFENLWCSYWPRAGRPDFFPEKEGIFVLANAYLWAPIPAPPPPPKELGADHSPPSVYVTNAGNHPSATTRHFTWPRTQRHFYLQLF
jgi:hypothetical protein